MDCSGEEELSTEDELHFLISLHGAFLAFQNSDLLTEEGALDASILDAITTAILGVKGLPGFERYWRQRKDYLHSGFAAYVDEQGGYPQVTMPVGDKTLAKDFNVQFEHANTCRCHLGTSIRATRSIGSNTVSWRVPANGFAAMTA